ncbi:hypothetical protein CVT24_002399 [Panaeolus cyanescens]|uniref:Uncharacterized protein n=1 Tax=Panaeolus cyanescens TaxID=181874 RepID=A0A409W104_9AGAR|nr:hypothetical protein CVT24_002399 [Panaeolus cyanescens]
MSGEGVLSLPMERDGDGLVYLLASLLRCLFLAKEFFLLPSRETARVPTPSASPFILNSSKLTGFPFLAAKKGYQSLITRKSQAPVLNAPHLSALLFPAALSLSLHHFLSCEWINGGSLPLLDSGNGTIRDSYMVVEIQDYRSPVTSYVGTWEMYIKGEGTLEPAYYRRSKRVLAVMDEVKVLGDSVLVVDQAFERVRIILGSVDDNDYKDKYGHPIPKLQPTWVGFQQRWKKFLWDTRNAARAAEAYIRDFSTIIIPEVENEEVEDAKLDLREFIKRHDPYGQKLNSSEARDEAQRFSQEIADLQADIARLKISFNDFAKNQEVQLGYEIHAQTLQVKRLDIDIKMCQTVLLTMGIVVGAVTVLGPVGSFVALGTVVNGLVAAAAGIGTATASVSKIMDKRQELEVAHQQVIHLDEQLDRLHQLQEILQAQTADIDILTIHLERFNDSWATVAHDAEVIRDQLEKAGNQGGSKAAFMRRIQILKGSYGTLADALSFYIDNHQASLPPSSTMSDAKHAAYVPTNDGEGPVFPFEIFETIINIIINSIARQRRSGFSKSDLISLSLVSKDFAAICQPHLVKIVRIHMSSPLNRVQQLLGAIKANPTLASYVKWLEYYEPDLRLDGPITAEKDGSLTPLLHLPRLQYLKVDGRGDQSYERPESQIGVFSFRSLLDQYMVSNTLTSLFIRCVSELPILNILSCPNLENLELRYCDLKSWDQPAPSKVLAKGFNLKKVVNCSIRDVAFPLLAYCSQLECLRVSQMGGFRSERPERFPISAPPPTSFKNVTFIESRGSVDWSYFCRLAESASVKAFPALKHLEVELLTFEDITQCPNLIFEHMQSLEEIRVEGRNHLDPTSLNFKRGFSLSAQTLRKVTIHWNVTLQGGHADALLKTVRIALQEISHSNVLQHLHLRWEITAAGGDHETLAPYFEQWNDLDLTLTADKGAAFPHLADVIIWLRFSGGVNVDEQGKQDYKNLFKCSMNRLFNSKDIRTSFDISIY